MEVPLVSVKMITYNHAPFIAQAIDCVLQQKTNFPFELVIGEDCSTDGTRDIVFEYQKKYPEIIRVITSDENVGMKANGIRTGKACRGKYIAFCEGDDYWHHPEKLQRQIDYLESHPECGLVYSSYDVYHPSSQKMIKDFIKYHNWEMPKTPSIYDFLEGKFELGLGILTCTIMVRRNLLEQIIEADPYLHQSGHFLMGDAQLWAELSTMANLHYIPESLATHVITDESATRSNDIKKRLQFTISTAEMYLYLFDKYKLSSSNRSNYESTWFESSLWLAVHERNGKRADELRKLKGKLNWSQLLKYWGAKYRTLNYIFNSVASVRNLLRKKYTMWT